MPELPCRHRGTCGILPKLRQETRELLHVLRRAHGTWRDSLRGMRHARFGCQVSQMRHFEHALFLPPLQRAAHQDRPPRRGKSQAGSQGAESRRSHGQGHRAGRENREAESLGRETGQAPSQGAHRVGTHDDGTVRSETRDGRDGPRSHRGHRSHPQGIPPDRERAQRDLRANASPQRVHPTRAVQLLLRPQSGRRSHPQGPPPSGQAGAHRMGMQLLRLPPPQTLRLRQAPPWRPMDLHRHRRRCRGDGNL